MSPITSLWKLSPLLLLPLSAAFVTSNPISPKLDRRRELTSDFSDLPNITSQIGKGGTFSVLGVAGLKDQSNNVYPRLELRELEKRTTQWNVFLLGLQRFQNVSQDDKLSYFQIAGIHGRPWIAWDGVDGDPQSDHYGYCQHSSTLFPTWHRPYLALFEEVLYLNARQVLLDSPNGTWKDEHLAALPSLRLPYWDWAAIPPSGEGSMPWSLQRLTIPITLPTGPTEIPNPLFSYRFHPIPSWTDEPDSRWSRWPQTIRNPTSLEADAKSQNDIVANGLDGNRHSMQSRVFGLLAMKKDYLPMSSRLQSGDSLESIHGTIHDSVGLDGNMLWLQYSAFDPAFWFHHTNVDRLIAIWQEVNRDSWVSDSTNLESSFAIPSGSAVNARTPLKPFRKTDSGDFWTSDDVRRWQTFGYTYRSLMNLTTTDSIVSRVNALYGPDARSTFSDSTSSSATYSTLRSRGVAHSGAPSFTGRRQYTANIKLGNTGFNGSMKFYFFFGEPTAGDVADWVDDKGFVGVTSVMTTSLQSNHEANTIVPLTAALETNVRDQKLESMEEGHVGTYLTDKLKWKIVKANGEPVGSDQIPTLKITVSWQEIEPAKSSREFPSLKGESQTLKIAREYEIKDGRFWGEGP